MGKHRGPILNTLLRVCQFCCTFCKALSRRSKLGIEYKRLFENNNRPLMLVEPREVAPTIHQHGDIDRRDFALVNHNRPEHLEKCRTNPLSEHLVPGECAGIALPFFEDIDKFVNLLARSLD